MAARCSAELAGNLEVGESAVLDDLGLRGREAMPLLTSDRPVVLEALTDRRLFFRFGKPPGKLDPYSLAQVISAEMQVELRVWLLAPALAAGILLLARGPGVWYYAVLSLISVACFLGFLRLQRVLEISVMGGRRFRIAGNPQILKGVALNILRELNRRDERAGAVFPDPQPVLFPPRAIAEAHVCLDPVKEFSQDPPSFRRVLPPGRREPPPAR